MQQPNTDLANIQMILLRTCFLNLQKAGVDTRPLTRLLSTLFGNVSEGLGYLAILNDTLSQPHTRSTRCAKMQLELLHEVLREMESTLTVSYAASLPETAKSSS